MKVKLNYLKMKSKKVVLTLLMSCITYITFSQAPITNIISDKQKQVHADVNNNVIAKTMACPLSAPLTASLVSTNATVPNNSTVTCNNPFYIKVTDGNMQIDPASGLTPCWKAEFNPIANLNTRGTANFYENANLFATLCPTCALNIGSTGGFTTSASIAGWYANSADYTVPHSVELCNGNLATGPSTVTIKGCWSNTVLAGPTVWNTAAAGCFTLSIPANSPSMGTADYSITPVAGAVGLTDYHNGYCNIDPSVMPTGTTYTVTYRFNSPTCGIITGTYKLTIPSTPTVTAISNQTMCSGSTVNSTVFNSSPSGSTYSWTNNNTSIGLGSSGTGSISAYVAPTVATTTIGIISVTPTYSGCVGSAANFSITINPKPTPTIAVSNASVCLGSAVSFTAGTANTYTWSGSAGNGLAAASGSTVSATPTNTGNITYTVNMTATTGCTNTINQTIAVIPNPTVTVNNPTICSGTSTVLTAGTATSYSWSTGAVTSTISVSPSSTTNYTVTGTNASGCKATAISQVSVNATPTVIVNNPTICSGTSTVLTAGTATSYSWSTGAVTSTISVSPVSTTNYTVTGTNAGGCKATAISQVSVNATPTVIVNNPTICSGTSTVLTAGTATSYSWSTGAITSTISVSPGSTTNYTVTGTNAGGCKATTISQVSVNVTPTITTSSSQSICSGLPVSAINFSINPGASVLNWSNTNIATGIAASGSGTTIAGFNAPNVSSITTGVITTTAIINGCSSNSTTTLTINPLPTVTVTPVSQTITCMSPTVTLLGSATPSTCIPSWSGGVGGAASYTATTSAANVYTLTVNNPANGCVASATTQVIPSPGFPSVTTSSTNIITCATTTAQVIATTTSTPVSYSWTGPIILSGANSPTATVNAYGEYTVVVTNTISLCSSTVTIGVSNNTTVITPTISVTGSITCTTPTITVTGSPATGVTYTWSGTGIVGSVNQQTVNVNAGGTFTLDVTNNVNGCKGTETVSVPVYTTTPTVSITPSSYTTTCAVQSVTISPSVSVPSLSYSWTAPSTGSLNNYTASNPVASGSGIFTVVVTNTVNGCSTALSQATVEIIGDAGIPAAVLSSPTETITCANPIPTITIAPSTPSVSYAWTPTVGIMPGTETTASPSFSAVGIYSVVITNTVTGCATAVGAYVVNVTQNTVAPTFTFASTNVNSDTLTCNKTSVTITPTVTPGNVNYSWTDGITTFTTTSVTTTVPASYTLTVMNSVTGCTNTVTGNDNVFTVAQNTVAPTFTFASTNVNSDTLTCYKTSVTITPTVTPSNVNYSWTDGITTFTTTSVTTTMPASYTLTVMNSVTGCTNNSAGNNNVFTVAQNITPPTGTISPVSTNTSIGCAGNSSTVTLGATTSVNSGYVWNPGNVVSPTFDITSAGVYSIFILNSVTGCTNTVSYSVGGNTIMPVITVTPNASIPCGTSTISLLGTTSTTNAVNYSWTGPGNITGSTTSTPVIDSPGTFTLTVTDQTNSCSSFTTVTVTQSNSSATITANPTEGYSPLPVSFNCSSTGATSWTWNFGDGNTSASQNTSNTFVNGGIYTVTLTASSGICSVTQTITIIVYDALTLEIPNVFTPNDDGVNDVFTIKSTGVKNISLQIFNRWGEKQYEFSGSKAAWDGLTTNGQQVNDGTYFFFVKATGFDDKNIERQGTVNLFR